MATPFEQAGYTKDTVFEILIGDDIGKHVKLSYDDDSDYPYFIDIAGEELSCKMYSFDPNDDELRVVENPKQEEYTPSVSNKLKFPLCVDIRGLSEDQVKDLTDKFVTLGADVSEHVGNITYNFWKYYGLTNDNVTYFQDRIGSFGMDTEKYSYEGFLKAFEESKTINDAQQEEETREESELKDSQFPEGFIPWSGGEIPVVKGTLVSVIYRNGEQCTVTAGLGGGDEGHLLVSNTAGKGMYDLAVDWKCDEVLGDIVAYRIEETESGVPQSSDTTVTVEIEQEDTSGEHSPLLEYDPVSVAFTRKSKFTVKGKFIIEQIGDSLEINVEDGEATFYQ